MKIEYKKAEKGKFEINWNDLIILAMKEAGFNKYVDKKDICWKVELYFKNKDHWHFIGEITNGNR